MKTLLFGFAILVIAAPLAGCNQQQGNKRHTAQERVEKGERVENGERGERRGRGHGLRRVCTDELQKYCAGDERRREKRECLQNHMDQLSADCKAAVEARGERRRRD
jgi:hypothetical protein